MHQSPAALCALGRKPVNIVFKLTQPSQWLSDPQCPTRRHEHGKPTKSYPISTPPKLKDGQAEQPLAVVTSLSLTVDQIAHGSQVKCAPGVQQHVGDEIPPWSGLEPRRQWDRKPLFSVGVKLRWKDLCAQALKQYFPLRRARLQPARHFAESEFADPKIKKRSPRFKRNQHTGAIYLNQYVLWQVVLEIHPCITLQQVLCGWNARITNFVGGYPPSRPHERAAFS